MRFERKSVCGTFQQVTRWSPCTHVTLSSYAGQDESCPLLQKTVVTFSKVMGTIVDVAFYMNYMMKTSTRL